VDVAIVGAGLAGLVCAARLVEAGASVRVLEASDRVGGRTRGLELHGAPFDLGGQWIGPGQDRAIALVRELGLETFETPHEGEHVIDAGGRLHRYRGTIPWLGVRPLAELGLAVARTYARSMRVPLEGSLARHDRVDRDSVEALVSALGPSARGVFDGAFRTVFGAEAREVSLLWYLLYARAGGGFFRLVDVEGGAQERRIVEGAYTLAARLHAKLGDRVALGAPVSRVVQKDDGVELHARDEVVRAKRAVLAVPLGKVSEIAFEPALPRARIELAERARMGATVKVHAIYARPFWRERGLSGQAVSGRGPISVLFDNTSHHGRVAALVAFVVGDEARRWSARPPEERRRAVLDRIAEWLGAQAREPIEYLEHDWSEERWVGGCPVASPPPGVLASRATALREPSGRVHFAGTETATRNIGYLDGAISSGERAAREVIDAL
jgi:monoamine oxidase